MNITDMISKSGQPPLYEKGSDLMWTDEYISKQILNIHLNPEIDLGSRKKSTIIKTADWILERQQTKGSLKILDLGCGPGLYSEYFAQKGHKVTGVDISKTSIEYAKESAAGQNLDIEYFQANYLETEFPAEEYDLAVLIYTDFGVLSPKEQQQLLHSIYKTLKTGGIFILDVLNDNNIEIKTTPRSWEASANGFWKAEPYLALSESFLYPKEKVVLFQHLIINEKQELSTYRFWTHFFSENDMQRILTEKKFRNVEISNDVLPPGDLWNGENVLFCVAQK